MIKTNPTLLLKFPQGLWKAANEKNLLIDLIFYYQLKCINAQGCLTKEQIVSVLFFCQKVPFSEKHIFIHIKRSTDMLNKIKSFIEYIKAWVKQNPEVTEEVVDVIEVAVKERKVTPKVAKEVKEAVDALKKAKKPTKKAKKP
jgi:hypothetical protein